VASGNNDPMCCKAPTSAFKAKWEGWKGSHSCPLVTEYVNITRILRSSTDAEAQEMFPGDITDLSLISEESLLPGCYLGSACCKFLTLLMTSKTLSCRQELFPATHSISWVCFKNTNL
jgi:hypothetical protein